MKTYHLLFILFTFNSAFSQESSVKDNLLPGVLPDNVSESPFLNNVSADFADTKIEGKVVLASLPTSSDSYITLKVSGENANGIATLFTEEGIAPEGNIELAHIPFFHEFAIFQNAVSHTRASYTMINPDTVFSEQVKTIDYIGWDFSMFLAVFNQNNKRFKSYSFGIITGKDNNYRLLNSISLKDDVAIFDSLTNTTRTFSQSREGRKGNYEVFNFITLDIGYFEFINEDNSIALEGFFSLQSRWRGRFMEFELFTEPQPDFIDKSVVSLGTGLYFKQKGDDNSTKTDITKLNLGIRFGMNDIFNTQRREDMQAKFQLSVYAGLPFLSRRISN